MGVYLKRRLTPTDARSVFLKAFTVLLAGGLRRGCILLRGAYFVFFYQSEHCEQPYAFLPVAMKVARKIQEPTQYHHRNLPELDFLMF